MTDQPNVLFVFSDQHRAATVGYAGAPNVVTPNFDRLAGQSLACTRAVSVVPVCTPARASLLTGRYPLTHGLFINDVHLENAFSVGEAFARAGYHTGYIGKWHINGGAWDAPIVQEDRLGFQFWRGWECGHDYDDSHYWIDGEAQKWEGYDAFAQTDCAIEYMRAQAGGAPFCLFVSWGPPHDPYGTAPEEFRRMYHPEDMVLRDNVPEECREQAREAFAGYCAHVSALDACMGRLMGCLQELGIAEDTVLVYTSDHGDMLFSRGEWTKQKPWDESVLVPFLLRYPRRYGRQGRNVEMPFNSMDVMPTLLDLCGVEVPATVEGRSMVEDFQRRADPVEDAALFSCIVPIGSWSKKAGGREYRGVRTARYTYVRDLRGPWLLYDTDVDPLQQENLCGRDQWRQVQNALDRVLQRKLDEVGDEFRSAEEYAAKWGYDLEPWGY